MLLELVVKDFAIIQSLRLSFMDGLNVITGETGAGKSILVGALSLLLGGRASSEYIRTGSDTAVVEGLFSLAGNRDLLEYLHSCGIDTGGDSDVLAVRREISVSGRNRIFIGSRIATLQMLNQIIGRLIDISGQYSQQLLLQVENHIDILDEFGGITAQRNAFQKQYRRFIDKTQKLESLQRHRLQRQERLELLSFQQDEIAGAALQPGEDADLEKEKSLLVNAQQLYDKTYGSYAGIYERDESCITALQRIVKNLEEAAAIDESLMPLCSSLNESILTIEDVAFTLRDYAQKIDFDPARLEAVEDRHQEIQRLKRKYGMTADDILLKQTEIQKELEQISDGDEQIKVLEEALAHEADTLWTGAIDISAKRNAAAKQIKKKVEKELASIGMKDASFMVHIMAAEKPESSDVNGTASAVNEYGIDNVEFYISTNPGEEPRPLSKIASGGEISRIVLAIKHLLAEHYRVPTLLFDEVDAGIGGVIASSVGKKLQEIAISHQVLCITHLPQIACCGKHHYRVEKTAHRGRSVTRVTALDDAGRQDELSRMIGGDTVTERTRSHAREMLDNARRQ